MQVIRQSLTIAIQRPAILVRPSAIIQQIRYDGGDPRSSTSSENHKNNSKSNPSSPKSSDLNKSKGGDKKKRSSSTDDTKQPGTTRKDWSKPDQVVGNEPTYGKASSSKDSNNPKQGKQ